VAEEEEEAAAGAEWEAPTLLVLGASVFAQAAGTPCHTRRVSLAQL